MDVDESCAQLTQLIDLGGCVVDECTALAGRRELAPDDAGVAVEVQLMLSEEAVHAVTFQVKLGLDDAAVAASLDGAGVCALPQQEADGTQKDALARTCLAGDDRESAVKADIQCLDKRIVLNDERLQHDGITVSVSPSGCSGTG